MLAFTSISMAVDFNYVCGFALFFVSLPMLEVWSIHSAHGCGPAMRCRSNVVKQMAFWPG